MARACTWSCGDAVWLCAGVVARVESAWTSGHALEACGLGQQRLNSGRTTLTLLGGLQTFRGDCRAQLSLRWVIASQHIRRYGFSLFASRSSLPEEQRSCLTSSEIDKWLISCKSCFHSAELCPQTGVRIVVGCPPSCCCCFEWGCQTFSYFTPPGAHCRGVLTQLQHLFWGLQGFETSRGAAEF